MTTRRINKPQHWISAFVQTPSDNRVVVVQYANPSTNGGGMQSARFTNGRWVTAGDLSVSFPFIVDRWRDHD